MPLYLDLLVYAALSFALTNPQPLAMRESSLVVLQGTEEAPLWWCLGVKEDAASAKLFGGVSRHLGLLL